MSVRTIKGALTRPAFSFNSERTTGVDSLATNQLDFIVNGVSVAQVTSSGIVNTGTVSNTTSTNATTISTSQSIINGTSATAAGVLRRFIVGPITCADAAATDLCTVTVPNAAHKALIKLTFLSALGAGGAVGADEACRVGEYLAVVARTAGVATVVTLATVAETATSAVAGAATNTTAITATSMTGATSATQTFKFQATITKGSGSSDNHKIFVVVEVLNGNASGISIA